MAWIEIKGFSYTYPGETVPALRDVDLALGKGAFVVFTGKSGSGKSTLGKALAGFLFADESPQYTGEIIVNGTDMSQVPLFEASQRVAYVQQNPEDQFCTLTVVDEIAFGLENACVNPKVIEERIDQALSVVNGSHIRDRDLHTLSGGEKQKVAIASMLALSPDVLILDEPTSNLDPIATSSIFETLHRIRQIKNMTVIIIEHKLTQLIQYTPELFCLDDGHIRPGLFVNYQGKSMEIDPEEFSLKQDAVSVSEPIMKLHNLSVARGNQKILQGLNLSLMAGQFVAIMGPNGSGKSTLLQTLMGFHDITSGECEVLRRNSNKANVTDFVPELGFIFQNPDHQLFEQSVCEEATFTLRNLNALSEKRKITAQNWLSRIGLGDRLEDHPQKLSYGQKRRLNLLSAMLHNPKLLLIDEFLIGQDMGNAHLWMGFFKKLTQLGWTILLVIHHPELTLRYCDRLIFLEDGKVLINEKPETAFMDLNKLNYHAFLPEHKPEFTHA